MNQAQPSITTINDVLKLYLDAIDSGFGLIEGDVRWLFNALLVLNIAVAALFWAFSDDQVLVPLIRKALYIGIFAWIIQDWQSITTAFSDTFMFLGIRAGGGRIDTNVLHHPGKMAKQGWTLIQPMLQAIMDISGKSGFYDGFGLILLLCVAVLVVILAYFFIAIQMAMALLTFKLGTLVAFILLPFALFTHTTFIAERPLGWVVTASVRFMVLTLVLSLGDSVFARLLVDPNKEVTAPGILGIALAAVLFMVLTLTASRLATDLATGTPRLGAMDAALALSGTALSAKYVVTKSAPAAAALGGRLADLATVGAVKAAAAVKSHFGAKASESTASPESAASNTNKEPS